MNNLFGLGMGYGPGVGLPLVLLSFLPIIMVWSLFWKGLALWHSAQQGEKWWFVIMLLLNTIGILEIVYLFAVLKLKPSQLFSSKVSSTGSML